MGNAKERPRRARRKVDHHKDCSRFVGVLILPHLCVGSPFAQRFS